MIHSAAISPAARPSVAALIQTHLKKADPS
ncbi:UNVERIFIED_ORG: hypothetical protein ABIB52_002187 [Arthrobacter sp. UYCu721]